MEIKQNRATINRPKGDRIIDAPYVYINIPELIDQITSEKSWQKNDRNGITIYKSQHMTMVVSALQEGAKINDNTINSHFTIQVLEGKLKITAVEIEKELQQHEMAVFHPGVMHTVETLTDSILLFTTFQGG